jgi:hypothetical protein
LTDTAIAAIRKHISALISDRIRRDLSGTDNRHAWADCIARFWRDTYYSLLFPLRLQLCKDDNQYRVESLPHTIPDQGPFRSYAAQSGCFPPIWPAADNSCELIADHVLARTAVGGLLLRAAGYDAGTVDSFRLASLIEPVYEELCSSWQDLNDLEEQVKWVRQNCAPPYPQNVDPRAGELLQALYNQDITTGSVGHNDQNLFLVLGSVQRVKKYVFDAGGLNEIRGASLLLDAITQEIADDVSNQLGPEVVLRQAGATIEFLSHKEVRAGSEKWPQFIERLFTERTGGVFAVATMVPASATNMLRKTESVIRSAYQELEERRAVWVPVQPETLPFEARCEICNLRAADGWYRLPGSRLAKVCTVCITKRAEGLAGRRSLVARIFEELNITKPAELGVVAPSMAQAVPQVFFTQGATEQGEKDRIAGMIPLFPRRKVLATIYADGNNFGKVVQNLQTLSDTMQWTHRVRCTSEVITAVSLLVATREVINHWQGRQSSIRLERLPFQILALGGDDLILFAWGPVALLFSREFLRWTDYEFEPGVAGVTQGAQVISQRISFSMGILLSDEKTPVRRAIDFTEEVLMKKWAKGAHRATPTSPTSVNASGGNLSFFLAITAEQIPNDPEDALRSRYLLSGQNFNLCLTLRPYNYEEWAWILDVAQQVQQQRGELYRMLGAMVASSPAAALLHAMYQLARAQQRARARGGPTPASVTLKTANLPPSLNGWTYPAAQLPNRIPLGIVSLAGLSKHGGNNKSLPVWFTPLADIVEILKVFE